MFACVERKSHQRLLVSIGAPKRSNIKIPSAIHNSRKKATTNVTNAMNSNENRCDGSTRS
jgi:hypothetical protein